MSQVINHEKLHQEFKEAGLPVVGVSDTGRVDYSRALTAAEKELAQSTIAAHDPAVTDEQVFLEQLNLMGISRDNVLYALWNSLANTSMKELNTLKEKIQQA